MDTNKLTATILDFSASLPSTIYWDASFIVNFSHEASTFYVECAAFLQRLKASSTLSVVSPLALDEAWFALLQVFIQRDYAPRKFWKVYESDPKVILPYIEGLEAFTTSLYNEPQIRIIGTRRHSPLDALENMRRFYLLPRDAMHLALMRQYRVTAMATVDSDFYVLEGITLYTCNPQLLNPALTSR